MTGSLQYGCIGHKFSRNRTVVPQMSDIIQCFEHRNRSPKDYLLTINISTSIQVIVSHPLKQILKMSFVRLEYFLHDSNLSQDIGQARHDHRIQDVYLQVELISYVESIEGNPLDESDARDVLRVTIVHISAVANC